MAHFAQLDENNIVIEVIAVHNNEITFYGREIEQIGIAFCKNLYGESTNWIQTSFNSSFRKNYAGIGYTYDVDRDAFIPPKPYPSWVLNETTCTWDAPVAMPVDENMYTWNEETTSWDVVATE